jgi:hypothetical protein
MFNFPEFHLNNEDKTGNKEKEELNISSVQIERVKEPAGGYLRSTGGERRSREKKSETTPLNIPFCGLFPPEHGYLE